MWSAKHNLPACQACGTTVTPHRAHGLCRNCYAKSKGFVWQKQHQQKHRAKITTYAREWARANPASVAKTRRKYIESDAQRARDQARKHLRTWRVKNRAPFCIVCGEDRVAEWAHLVPHCDGGPVAPWNLVPLCPTHHRCFDLGLMTEDERQIVEPYLAEAKERMVR